MSEEPEIQQDTEDEDVEAHGHDKTRPMNDDSTTDDDDAVEAHGHDKTRP